MPSHYSTIGFPLTSPQEMIALAQRVAPLATPLDVDGGRYLFWSSPAGAELWLQTDDAKELIGMNPHFSGRSRVRVRLDAGIYRPDDTPLDGAFHGWADPQPGETPGGSYPFVFDMPDRLLLPPPLRQPEPELPVTVEVQIAAFAHDVSVYDSPVAFQELQTSELKFAAQSFIPAGLFTPDGENAAAPQAHALFAGDILAAEQRRNELTNEPFWWVLVESLGGTFDVVVDPSLFGAPPRVGGILQGHFWLSGRILAEQRRG